MVNKSPYVQYIQHEFTWQWVVFFIKFTWNKTTGNKALGNSVSETFHSIAQFYFKRSQNNGTIKNAPIVVQFKWMSYMSYQTKDQHFSSNSIIYLINFLKPYFLRQHKASNIVCKCAWWPMISFHCAIQCFHWNVLIRKPKHNIWFDLYFSDVHL